MNRPRRKGVFARLLRNWSGLVGLLLVTGYVFVALFAAFLAPYPPNEQHPVDRLQPPNAQYRLGTDEFGRDILSRVIYGAQNSLEVALSSVVIATLLGAAIGISAGYVGGMTDNVSMRLVDLLFAFPAILLGGVHNVMVAKVWEIDRLAWLAAIVVLLALRLRLPDRARQSRGSVAPRRPDQKP